MKNFKIDHPNTTLVDLVENRLMEYFKESMLKPGDSIPKEIELARFLGVGRSVLREALSRFRMLGIIQTRTKRGMIISDPNLLAGIEKVIEPSMMSLKSIKEILGLRIAIEIGNTPMIFKNISESDIQELEEIIMYDDQSMLNQNKFSPISEHAFHLKLNAIAGNELIYKYQKVFYKVFIFVDQNYGKYFEKFNKKKSKDNSFVSHRDLLEQLKKRNQNKFQNLMEKHLEIYVDFIYS